MFDYFVGYDPRERDAYHVCVKSAVRRSSVPLRVHALMEDHLRATGDYWRTDHRLGALYKRRPALNPAVRVDDGDGRPFSTAFAFTRFLVPHLMRWSGWALFTDCDFLWLDDPARLIELLDPAYAVMVVKHDHRPTTDVKMDGQVQQSYARKNWSSLVLWNCAHEANRALTVAEVNGRPGGWLHGFRWLDDALIGALPERWNYLVDAMPDSPLSEPLGAVHFTLGGPWFESYKDCSWAGAWRAERDC